VVPLRVSVEVTQTKGSFEATLSAISKLVENDVPLQINCPILKQNKESYGDVLQWAKIQNVHVGCDYVIIAKCNHTTQNLRSRLSLNDIKEIVRYKIASEPQYLEQMEKEVEKKSKETLDENVCSVCHSSICIADNGNAYPCAGWQGYVVENIKESSLRDIWNNSQGIHYLRGLRKRDFPKCIECPEKNYCTMCMVRNANEDRSGNPLAVNEYFCNIAKINKELLQKRNIPGTS